MKHLILVATLLAAPAAAQTQATMSQQAGSDAKAADAAMTAQWTRTYAYMKRLDAQDTSRGGGFGYAGAALNSQRAWLKYRDAECVIEGGEFAGGSLEIMTHGQCIARLTRDRAKQLIALRWKHP